MLFKYTVWFRLNFVSTVNILACQLLVEPTITLTYPGTLVSPETSAALRSKPHI